MKPHHITDIDTTSSYKEWLETPLTNLTSNLATKKQNKTNLVLVHELVIALVQVLKSTAVQLLKPVQNKQNDLIPNAFTRSLVILYRINIMLFPLTEMASSNKNSRLIAFKGKINYINLHTARSSSVQI
jgi:hypothetical protein